MASLMDTVSALYDVMRWRLVILSSANGMPRRIMEIADSSNVADRHRLVDSRVYIS